MKLNCKFDGCIHIKSGNKAKANSFSGPVVFMSETAQHSVPNILQNKSVSPVDWPLGP